MRACSYVVDAAERERDRDRAGGAEDAEHVQHGPAAFAIEVRDQRVCRRVHGRSSEAHEHRSEQRLRELTGKRQQEQGGGHQQRSGREHTRAPEAIDDSTGTSREEQLSREERQQQPRLRD